jgi:5-methylcytosine-specific restriction enzyme subunit McrC
MKLMGVSGAAPTKAQLRSDRFGRHSADDRVMIAAALLAFDLALPTQTLGSNALPSPDREQHWARKLFENAIAGFYEVCLTSKGWKVTHGNTLIWPIDQKTQGIQHILPTMRTDIILEQVNASRRIIIDTKFTSILTKGWYREQTLRSGYLYQMYAYLRSQVGQGDLVADHSAGLLLHPSVGDTVDEAVVIQGHRIRFATVDLTASSQDIRARLLDVCSFQ